MTLLSAETKLAVLLKTLPPETTDALIGQLGTEDALRLRTEIERLQREPASAQTVDDVLAEFDGFFTALEGPADHAPAAAARENGESAAPAEQPETPPTERPAAPASASTPTADGTDPFVALKLLGAERLAAALADEQPRTTVLVLNHLPTSLAGEVLKRFTPTRRREVSLLLGQAAAVPRAVLHAIAEAVLQKGLAVQEKPQDTSDHARARQTAEVLRQLDRAERLAIVNALAERDPEAAARVKDHLYQFDDLLLVDDRSVQRILAEFDSRSLVLAVKGASEKISTKLLNNLSRRARETLTEEMEFVGNAAPAQIQQAQKTILEAMQRLDLAGELVMLE